MIAIDETKLSAMLDTAGLLAIPSHGYAITCWLNAYFSGTDIAGAEIGVFAGNVSSYLLKTHPRLKLTMVDAWSPVMPGSTLADSGDELVQLQPETWPIVKQLAMARTNFAAGRRCVLCGDSVLMADKVNNESLDFIFIDADHSYEGCLNDLKAWCPKVKPKGIICGHDYETPRYPQWGVKRAIRDFGITRPFLGMNYTWCFPKAWL